MCETLTCTIRLGILMAPITSVCAFFALGWVAARVSPLIVRAVRHG